MLYRLYGSEEFQAFPLENSFSLIVGLEDLPAVGAHETWRGSLASLGHSSHAGAGDELKVLLDATGTSEELHLGINFIVSGDLERKNLDTLEHRFAVYEELLSVPDVIEGDTSLLGVTNTSGVTSSDEMCDTAGNAG